ncbi:regulatory protein IE2 [Saimiriine betaherpesvirus 4]|uniref:Regulatory protein IE2 n=1 Tax=Saimiriine betaherpesvirus 4 TaxID=1535247 RepID=G8XT18_9BETA|nr:regulatory protein IE2 [Saimiriine betaherpesvirus 4]AEV80964.1 regulatory protein IE2 [Saimiriine betaherpesvirus 4]
MAANPPPKRPHDDDDPGEGTSSGPSPPKQPKIFQPEDPVTIARRFIQKTLNEEVKTQLSLGDPLFPVADNTDDDPFKECLGGIDILAEAASMAGILDSSSTNTPGIIKSSSSIINPIHSTPSPDAPYTPSPPFPEDQSPRKRPRKSTPMKMPPEWLPMKVEYNPQPITTPTSSCIVISDSDEEHEDSGDVNAPVCTESVECHSESLVVGKPQSPCTSSSSSSSSSESDSDTSESKNSPTAPPATKKKRPGKKQQPSFEPAKVRSILKTRMAFDKPTGPAKRGRVKMSDISRMFRATTRSLEYKNLPFKPTPMNEVLESAIAKCKTMNTTRAMFMIHYTRTYNVKSAIEDVRAQLGMICNLSISSPFTLEHTAPMVHSPSTVRNVSKACEDGVKGVWDLKEDHTHQLCPRSSDYRTIMVHAATPADYLQAIKVCLPLLHKYPRQVCIRTADLNKGENMLPIYDDCSSAYVVGQFQTGNDDMDTLNQAVQKAIEDLE